MTKIMKKLTLVIALLMFVGCDEQLDLTNPNEPTADTFWETETDAVRASYAMYNGLIMDGTYMRMIPALTDGRSDGFKADTPWPDLWQTAAFNVPATSGPVEWVWREHYVLIYRTNQVLELVPDMEIDEALKERIVGQAHFLRGLAYFNLANNFHRVPISDAMPEPDEFNEPTASEEELWQQIIDDFNAAKERLPISYENVDGPDQGQIGRATAGAATGMLGKAYLYREQWQNAADEFELLMDGNSSMAIYSLVDDYRNNFNVDHENNEESLFEVQFASPEEVGGSDMNYCCEPNSNWMQVSSQAYTYAAEGYGYSDFLPTQWLYDEFHEEQTVDGNKDPRLLDTIVSYEPTENSTTVYGDPWPYSEDEIYPRKYTNEGLPQPELREQSGINYRVLRFADILLMYAEARNELGDQSTAAQYIQRVRDRANLPDRVAEFSGYTQEEMREQIAHERALEFAIEGQRIHDMIRWGWFEDPDKIEELRQRDSEFDSWDTGDEYLPIPQRELDVNPNLEPNPANN